MTTANNSRSVPELLRSILLFVLFLYLFLLSIQLMGHAFKLFGEGFAERLIRTTSSPLAGLFIGLLATAVIQSSSTTTSIVVGLVAGGALTLHNAIPIVMGANIGTTVTNLLVSLGHISKREEFRRAFAASVVHDVFNFLAVMILFPLQYYTGYLEHAALALTSLFGASGGLEFASPLKLITEPASALLTGALGSNGITVLAVSMLLLFLSLRYMVKYMKELIMNRAEVVFERTVFRTPLHGLLFGLMLTALVQSSSVTTSLIVPLAGAGLVTLQQVFPYTLGANIGTTVTAILAALATGSPIAVAVAFSHLLFNLSGMAIFWWMQSVPIGIATRVAALTVRSRGLAVAYILVLFFILPLTLLYFLE